MPTPDKRRNLLNVEGEAAQTNGIFWKVLAWVGAVLVWGPVFVGGSFLSMVTVIAAGAVIEVIAVKKLKENHSQQTDRNSIVLVILNLIFFGGILLFFVARAIQLASR